MKYTVKEFSDKFLSLIGDETLSISEPFLINGLNWAFNELPRVPKLEKLFSKHYTLNLDAEDHYKWNLNQDFRRLNNLLYLNFWTSTGGEPCRINLCHQPVEIFYRENGLPEMRKAGTPCHYTIEQEGDNILLVMDRPLDIPMIVDCIAYGYPKPVSKMSDDIELSAVAENLIIGLLRVVATYESMDYNFAGSVLEYLSNYALEQAIQELNKRWKVETPILLGEA